MKTLVIGPHPDDELLGCGGTLLRKSKEGNIIGWVLMTAISEEYGWSAQKMKLRDVEIERIRDGINVSKNNFFPLGFETTKLDQVPKETLISSISKIFTKFEPEEILLPYPGDAHSDHRLTFEAVSACTKWFRYPSVKRVLVYETPSETDFGLDPTNKSFNPNVYIDITDYFDEKIKLLKIYKSEIGKFPFPRSIENINALGKLRGSQSGYKVAEAFMLLKERI